MEPAIDKYPTLELEIPDPVHLEQRPQYIMTDMILVF